LKVSQLRKQKGKDLPMNTAVRTTAQFVLAFLLSTMAALAENVPSIAEPASATTTLVILANRRTQQRLLPVLVSTLRREAAAASHSSPVNANVEIVSAGNDVPGPAFPSRIEVELLGTCDDPWNMDPPAHSGPLGYVFEDSGIIAPVIYVDCAQLNQLMSPLSRTMTENQRLHATSEAISHVIIHEWIHIATQSSAHAPRGIMQSQLSSRDLTTPIAETKTDQSKSQSQPQNDDVMFLRHFTRLLIADR
jgi:hypothetical protein